MLSLLLEKILADLDCNYIRFDGKVLRPIQAATAEESTEDEPIDEESSEEELIDEEPGEPPTEEGSEPDFEF